MFVTDGRHRVSLARSEGQEERRRALAAVAGVSPVGQKRSLLRLQP